MEGTGYSRTPTKRYDLTIPKDHYFKYNPSYNGPNHSIFSLYYPSDSNPAVKIPQCTLIGAIWSVPFAWYHITERCGFTDFKFQHCVEVALQHGPAIVVAGATYGLVTSFGCSMRKKSDYINHGAAGYAAGAAIGVWYKSKPIRTWLAAVAGITSAVIKYYKDEADAKGEDLYQMPNRGALAFNKYRSNYFFTAKPNPEESTKDWDKDTRVKDYDSHAKPYFEE